MLDLTRPRIKYCLQMADEARRLAGNGISVEARHAHVYLEDCSTLRACPESLSERVDLHLSNGRHDAGFLSDGSQAGGSGGNHRTTTNSLIVVIDDDEAVCRAVRTLLTSLGYEASAFTSAESYLRSNLIERTACLIVDVHMPGLSGPDFQARVQAEGHRIPIILVTGSPDDTIRARVLEAGAVDYLTKPFNQQTLVAALTRALARQ